MKTSPSTAESEREFVKRSGLYQEFLAERKEILKHKWLESEKAGHDIGFERALLGFETTATFGERNGAVIPSPAASSSPTFSLYV